jgi:tetratricopeptide (TPR) repeat protein
MPRSQGRVLIVDDERSVRNSLPTPLSALAFEIEEAAGAEQAVCFVRSEHYDAALRGINMSGIGGVETKETASTSKKGRRQFRVNLFSHPPFSRIIPGMGLPFRFTLQAIFIVTVYFIPVFGQTGGDQVGAVSGSLRAGEFDRALQLLHPMLKESPSNPQLWTLQALAYAGTKRNKDALESFQRALKVSPDYLAALEGAAQLEYEAGSGEAIPLLHRILTLRPGDPTSHAMLAVLEYHRGNCLAALQNFDMSGELANSQADALRARGSCLVMTKQLDKAISVFERLLEMNPSDTVVRCQLASVELMADRPREAIGALTPALETSDPSVLQLASSAYEAMNDTPDAVRVLRQAIVNNPRDVDLYVDFADLSMEHQSFQVGIDVINSGLRIQPASAPLYVARGVLFVQLAKFDEAEADFENANSLDPKTSLGAVAQGLVAIESSDPDRALGTVRAKLAKKPNDPSLLYLEADILGKILLLPENRARARELSARSPLAKVAWKVREQRSGAGLTARESVAVKTFDAGRNESAQ